MVQILEKSLFDPILIEESKDVREIREVLDEILYAPDTRVRYYVMDELCNYIQSKFTDPEYKLKVFIAYQGIEVLGFVIAQIDPNYTSYSRKCGTFGWLYANSLDTCKHLLKQCEMFI
ncbi:hypothetical protein LCGC14_2173200, partial [marine sediment metagenome]